MDIRQLRYLVSLARERHFARAAEACGVAQPTLSAGLRQLEEELGVPVVKRGNRFKGLTPEGERVLAWARCILADCDALEQELAGARRTMRGQVVVGVIPSALPMVAALTEALLKQQPGISVRLLSQSSIAGLAAVVPQHLPPLLGLDAELLALPLEMPVVTHHVGLVVADRHPAPPFVAALWTAAEALRVA